MEAAEEVALYGSWKSHARSAKRAAREARVGTIKDVASMALCIALVFAVWFVFGFFTGIKTAENVNNWASQVTAQ